MELSQIFFYGTVISTGRLVQKIASWKNAARSAVCVLQQLCDFLSYWQQPEQLI